MRFRNAVAAGLVCIMAAGVLVAAPKGTRRRKPRPIGGGQYKRIGLELMRLLAAGKTDRAAAEAEKVLANDADNHEAMVILAAARARQGRCDEAVGFARKAVEGGLPVGRLLAGPRELLKPLTECKGFAELLVRAKAGPLLHGPALARVAHDRAGFWVRTADETGVEVTVTPAGGGKPAGKAAARTKAADDFTAVPLVTGLEPDTAYTYRLRVGGQELPPDANATFRTFPSPGAKARFRVVFGGGAGYTPWHERIWNVVAKREPLAFLAMGDNVYIDTPKSTPVQRYCYYRRQSRPEYRGMTAGVPVYAIWDDHDFGTNDCQGSPGIDDIPWKLPVWNVFRQNYANPAYGGGEKAPGVWFDFAIGDVHFFMLDCRFYRTRRGKPGGTMLGPVQKRWLLDRLAGSKATFKVLCSSVPWTKGTKPGSKDTWDGFEAERREIFACIDEHRIDGVFLISADRHRSDAYKTERPGAYPLYEASSSRLTNMHTHRAMKHSLFCHNKTCSFALLTFDTAAADPALSYDVVTIDNEVPHTLKIKLSDISFGGE